MDFFFFKLRGHNTSKYSMPFMPIYSPTQNASRIIFSYSSKSDQIYTTPLFHIQAYDWHEHPFMEHWGTSIPLSLFLTKASLHQSPSITHPFSMRTLQKFITHKPGIWTDWPLYTLHLSHSYQHCNIAQYINKIPDYYLFSGNIKGEKWNKQGHLKNKVDQQTHSCIHGKGPYSWHVRESTWRQIEQFTEWMCLTNSLHN